MRSACSKSLNLPATLPLCLRQLPGTPACIRTPLQTEILSRIQLFVQRCTSLARRSLQLPGKLLRRHDEPALHPGKIDNLTTGRHPCTIGSIFGSQTLDHLTGFFAPLRKDHLKPKLMFAPFRAPALLPPVADHGHRMGFFLTVGS